MAQRRRDIISFAVRACPRRGASAAGQYHGVIPLPDAVSAHYKSIPIGRNLRNQPPAMYRHAAPVHFIAQHVQHGGSLSAGRIEIPVPALDAHPQLLKERSRLLRAEHTVHRAKQRPARAKITSIVHFFVGEIAPAVAGGQQFLPDSVVSLVDRRLRACPRRTHCRRHTRRAAADHRNLSAHHSLRLHRAAGRTFGHRMPYARACAPCQHRPLNWNRIPENDTFPPPSPDICRA